jgi:Leucine-rich repeat (LRR) protein
MMIMMKSVLLILVLPLLFGAITANDSTNDWESKCNKCRCHWKSSKKTADCRDTGQVTIPIDLHTDIQSLDLSNNRIAEIRKNEMSDDNLYNLHKLIIANSTLELVDREAFSGLSILIELDLSNNEIRVIHAGTFHPLIKIRKILLHDNQLTAIEDRTFENLMHLGHVELNNNKIHTIGDQAFLNVPLKTIYLGE